MSQGISRSVDILRIHSGTYEPRDLDCGTADTTCAKKTENALLEFIRHAGAQAPPRESNIYEPANRNKRRRLTHSREDTGRGNDRDNQELVHESVAGDSQELDGSVAGDGQELVHGSVAGDGQGDKVVEILTKKIRNGIKEKRKRIKTMMKQAASTEIALPTGKSMDDFIDSLWKKAIGIVDNAVDVAWKLRYIASCLRILQGINEDTTSGRNVIVLRWVRATRVINLIVNGLWQHWGPHAAFVFEALASKVNSPLQTQLLTHN